jgi:hypothetical protein
MTTSNALSERGFDPPTHTSEGIASAGDFVR